MTTAGKCAVCEQDSDDVTIACVPDTSITVEYCMPCIVANAQPFDILAMQVAAFGVDGDIPVELLPTVRDTLLHLGRSTDEFEAAIKSCMASIVDAMSTQKDQE